MGSLSNLYISQSYQSLTHLGTDNALVPGTMTKLEDGIGQSLNISFDGTNISSSGNIFAANITGSGGASINTGSLVTTSSFNSYTSSTNARLSSIETTTASLNSSVSALNTNSASVNISISNLNSATASLFTSASLALVTASFSGNTLTFTKGNGTTFGVVIPDVSGSAGDFVTTSSFNAYTSSTNNRLNNLETTSASVNISISNLNSTTASQGISITNLNSFSQSAQASINSLNAATSSYANSASVALVDANQQSQINSLIAATGSYLTASADITALNAFTSSQLTINTAIGASTSSLNTFSSSVLTQLSTLENVTSSLISKTGSYATTGSNTFIGDQTITGNITAFSASFTYLQTIFESSSIIYSSGSNQFGDELTDIQTLSGSVKVQGSLTVNGTPVQTSSVDITALNSFTASQLNINTGYNTFTSSTNTSITELSTFSASAKISISALNSATSSYAISSSVAAVDAAQQSQINSLINATGSYVTSAITASSLVTASFSGNTLTFTKGDSSTFGVIIPDVSGSTFDTGSFVTTSSFNSYTSSNDQKVNSLISATGSYATTGSNNFIGDQTITGSLLVSGSNLIDLNVVGRVSITGPGTGATAPRLFISGSDGAITDIGRNFNNINTTKVNDVLDASGQIYANTSSVAGMYIGVYDDPNFNTDVEINIIVTKDGSSFSDWDNGTTFSSVPFMTLAPNTGNNPTPVMTRGLNVTGSTQVQNFTASLANGFTYVGNSSGKTTTVATSSFATTIPTGTVSSSAQILNYGIFATTGSNTFRGNQNNIGTIQAADADYGAQYGAPTVFQGVGSASVAYDQFVNGGNYDSIHIQSNINAGTDFQDLQSDTFNYSTWLNIPTNTGNNPAPIMARGLNVTGNKTNLATTGSNTFTGLNQFNNGIKIQTSTPTDSFSEIAFQNNVSLQIATKSTLNSGQTGSFQLMTMSTGSGGQASFQMTAQISGTIGELKVSNSAGTSSVDGFADTILFAKRQGFPNTPATTFTAEARTINLKGGVEVSGSLTVQNGSSFFANGNKQFNVGAFQSSVNQSGSANVSQSMNFETTDISQGISIASNSRITLANSGTYNIQFSAQILADTGADDVYIWLKKNGTNVSASAGHIVLANNEELIAAWNYVVDAAASDYFELVWQNTNGDAILLTEAATGNIPSIPSIILTVTQVR
jgi:hypothetical protein